MQRDALPSAAANLAAKIPFYLFPPGRFPAVNFDEIIGIEGRDRHGCVRRGFLVCSKVFRPQLKLSFFPVPGFCQAVYGKTQIRQHLIVDDVIEKHSIGVKGFLRQNNAVVTGKCFVVADGSYPLME